MKDLIKRIVHSLVDNQEQVEVLEVKSGQATVFEVRVAREDLGKVIGKKGRTFKAIRSILSAASGKLKKHNSLAILDDLVGKKAPKSGN